MQAMAREEHLRQHPDPKGWLFRTGYNLAQNRWRLLLRRRHKLAQQYPVLRSQTWDDAIDLRSSLRQLSKRQREAIILHYYLGFSVEEVAETLNCVEGSIKSHLHRGRNALNQLLRQEASR